MTQCGVRAAREEGSLGVRKLRGDGPDEVDTPVKRDEAAVPHSKRDLGARYPCSQQLFAVNDAVLATC
jgi:hypothetical protein